MIHACAEAGKWLQQKTGGESVLGLSFWGDLFIVGRDFKKHLNTS